MFHFKEKDCPFCNGGNTEDERKRRGISARKCNHEFDLSFVDAQKYGLYETMENVKLQKKIIRKMEKIMELSNIKDV